MDSLKIRLAFVAYQLILENLERDHIGISDAFGLRPDYLAKTEASAARKILNRCSRLDRRARFYDKIAAWLSSAYFKDKSRQAELCRNDALLALAKLRIHPQRIADRIPSGMYEPELKTVVRELGLMNLFDILDTTRPSRKAAAFTAG